MPRPAFHVKIIVFNSENIHAAILIFEYSGLILNNIHINISKFNFARIVAVFPLLKKLCSPGLLALRALCSVMDSEAGSLYYL